MGIPSVSTEKHPHNSNVPVTTMSTTTMTTTTNLNKYGVHLIEKPVLKPDEITTLRRTINDRLRETAKLDLTDATTWSRWPLDPSTLYAKYFADIKVAVLPGKLRVTGIDLQPPVVFKEMLRPRDRHPNPSILSRTQPYHGSLQLTAQDPSVGSVWVLTGSHLLFEKFSRVFNHSGHRNHATTISLTKQEFQWYVRELRKLNYSGVMQRVVAPKAGQMVLWDSRLVCSTYMPAMHVIPEATTSPELALAAMEDIHVLDHYWRQAVYVEVWQLKSTTP